MPKFYFPNLPLEMNRNIYSYLSDFIVLDFLVDLRFDFPFSRPIWSLKHVEHSFNDDRLPISILDYYEYIVYKHNNRYLYKNNWTASLGIKNDLLLFISTIHHFEIFSDY